MSKKYKDLLEKIEKEGIQTDEFVRLFSHLSEFNLNDSKHVLNIFIEILEMTVLNDWGFKVPGFGIMKPTIFKAGTKGLATPGVKGDGAVIDKPVKRGERWYFALSENITNKARVRRDSEEE